jgi:hypothetical protein
MYRTRRWGSMTGEKGRNKRIIMRKNGRLLPDALGLKKLMRGHEMLC